MPDDDPLDDDPLEDATLRARYAVEEQIGRGGHGRVYRAIQKSTGQAVALKILAPGRRSPKAWARFTREARLCAALHHPHIVRLIDAHHRGEQSWLAFEWVPGQSLSATLRAEGRLEPGEAVRLMSQILDALSAAHTLGVVHRDIKPSNIMLTRTGARRNALVLDFGIGTRADGRETLAMEPLTATGEIIGTPAYAAPEQLRGEPATARTDLYAWALTFFECLTGARVITADTLPYVLVQQLSSIPIEPPPSVRGHRLGPILTRAVEKDPARRAVTAESLLRALDALDGDEIAALGPPAHPAADDAYARLDAPTLMTATTGGPASAPAQPARAPAPTAIEMSDEERALIARAAPLRRLSAGEIERFSGTLHRRGLVAGEVLADFGEPGADAYIVARGELVLELPVEGGRSRIVDHMGPGTVVGEVALVAPAPRTLRIRASRRGLIYVVDGARFRALCDADDPGAHKVLRAISRTLCDRLRQTSARLQTDLGGAVGVESSAPVLGFDPPVPAEGAWQTLKRLFRRAD